MESDYLPTEEDCIMARVRTSGIVETAFDYRDQALGQVHYRFGEFSCDFKRNFSDLEEERKKTPFSIFSNLVSLSLPEL